MPVVHQQQSNGWATLGKMFLNSPLFTNTQTTREQRWKCFFWNACCSPTPKQQTNNGDIRWFKKPVVHQRATTGKQRVPVGEQHQTTQMSVTNAEWVSSVYILKTTDTNLSKNAVKFWCHTFRFRSSNFACTFQAKKISFFYRSSDQKFWCINLHINSNAGNFQWFWKEIIWETKQIPELRKL